MQGLNEKHLKYVVQLLYHGSELEETYYSDKAHYTAAEISFDDRAIIHYRGENIIRWLKKTMPKVSFGSISDKV